MIAAEIDVVINRLIALPADKAMTEAELARWRSWLAHVPGVDLLWLLEVIDAQPTRPQSSTISRRWATEREYRPLRPLTADERAAGLAAARACRELLTERARS